MFCVYVGEYLLNKTTPPNLYGDVAPSLKTKNTMSKALFIGRLGKTSEKTIDVTEENVDKCLETTNVIACLAYFYEIDPKFIELKSGWIVPSRETTTKVSNKLKDKMS
jgi:hypothetical protein